MKNQHNHLNTYLIVGRTGEFAEIEGRDIMDALFSFKGNHKVIISITEKDEESNNPELNRLNTSTNNSTECTVPTRV